MERFRALEPIGRAGWSIRIYRADFSWPAVPPPGIPAARLPSPIPAPGETAP